MLHRDGWGGARDAAVEHHRRRSGASEPPRGPGMRSAGPPAAAPAPLHLSAVDLGAQDRIDTGLGEFNRVLGGGWWPGRWCWWGASRE